MVLGFIQNCLCVNYFSLKATFMNSITTSFFTKQKQLKHSVVNSNKNKFVVSNSAATYIFDQYVFAEDTLYKASLP